MPLNLYTGVRVTKTEPIAEQWAILPPLYLWINVALTTSVSGSSPKGNNYALSNKNGGGKSDMSRRCERAGWLIAVSLKSRRHFKYSYVAEGLINIPISFFFSFSLIFFKWNRQYIRAEKSVRALSLLYINVNKPLVDNIRNIVHSVYSDDLTDEQRHISRGIKLPSMKKSVHEWATARCVPKR